MDYDFGFVGHEIDTDKCIQEVLLSSKSKGKCTHLGQKGNFLPVNV